ncbi:proteasomal ATPase-associated factor 1-like [Strongylocentrotus purpuratus]|uniref:Proteasomal ATPase-associated factor 1 n=1 Tax=Strongylocentrotus purpuratus TaxID=7668 RepID=A0A7M7T318_STRPU|nr:proteasomal ATPase-associated factor 1-like [Strongylocentrotus purpuratus]
MWQKAIEGELRSHGVNHLGTPEVTVSEGFTVSDVTKRKITVACPEKNVSAQFVAPSTALETVHSKAINSLDISAGGALGVSASSDGCLRIWETATGIVRRELEGHAGEAETCQFFPSGMVVLSGGLDTQLKVWSVEDGSCPVTMTGHKRGIQDTAVIDKGRNVISCSLDGSARLWDCGQGKCLEVIGQGSDAINGCAVAPVCDGVDLGASGSPSSEREVGTDGKLLLLAREGGSLEGYGLKSRQKVFSMSGSSPFNCCTFLSSQILAGGAEDGNIYLIDVRNTSEPQSVIHQSASPVKCMLGYQDGFIASTSKFIGKISVDGMLLVSYAL